LEKSFGAADHGIKLNVFTSWQPWAALEGRKKRPKEHSMKSAIKSITGGQDLLKLHVILAWARVAHMSRLENLNSGTSVAEAKLREAVEEQRVAMEEDLVKAQEEAASLEKELEALKKDRDAAKGALEGLDDRLGQCRSEIQQRDDGIKAISTELEQSRRKAKDIGDELAKVGVFLHNHPARKAPRSGSGKDGSQSARGNDKTLPRIENGSRPGSGSTASRPGSGASGGRKDGSKSARGVAGERTGSASRRRKKSEERRYLDGAGPYTYAEFMDLLGNQGAEYASAQWQAALPAQTDYGNY
jgi:hypothetical protein